MEKVYQLIDGLGYNSEAMKSDNVSVDGYKKILSANGYDVAAMEKDGLFGTIEVATQQPQNMMTPRFMQNVPNPWEGKNTLDTTPKETVNPDGTISTLTTGQPEDKQGAFSENVITPTVEGIGQVVAGARQSVTLPLAKILEDGLNSIGFDVGNESSENLKKIKKYVDDYNDKHPDQVIHPATIGNIMSQVAVPLAKTKKAVAATEAVLSALHGIGQRGEYGTKGDIAIDTTIGAVFGAGTMALFERLTRSVGPLSYEAKLIIKDHPDMNEAQVVEMLKGVPKEDQAYALSNMLEDDYVELISKAVKPQRGDTLLLKEQLKGRTKVVQDVIGDTEKQVTEAKNFYSQMIDKVSLDKHNTFRFDDMVPKLDDLIKRYDGTPSRALGIVKNMKADLEAGQGSMNVRTALQFRQDLNYLLNKANRYEEKELLKSIKTGVDSFITKNLDNTTLSMVDDAISNYSVAMNNRDFVELMDKFIKKGTTDWTGFKKALKKEKLSSPQVDNAIDVVKEFSDKFKNDKQLRKALKIAGENPEDSGGMLSVWSEAISKLKDFFRFYGERYEKLHIQGAILKSIRNAKDPRDVFKILETDPNIPPKFSKALENILMIEYKPGAATSVTDTSGNVATKYVTPSGTVGSDMSTVALHDAQTALLQKALGERYTSQIDNEVKTILDSNRFKQVLNNVRARLTKDSDAANAKMLENIANTEAKVLIRNIEKSMGIKLPPAEAKKIIQIKLNEVGAK